MNEEIQKELFTSLSNQASDVFHQYVQYHILSSFINLLLVIFILGLLIAAAIVASKKCGRTDTSLMIYYLVAIFGFVLLIEASKSAREFIAYIYFPKGAVSESIVGIVEKN